VKTLGDALPMTNSAFRAFRLAPDHPALAGRSLVPAGTIKERAAQGIDVYAKRPQAKDPAQGGAQVNTAPRGKDAEKGRAKP
jgi:hypothetical protein